MDDRTNAPTEPTNMKTNGMVNPSGIDDTRPAFTAIYNDGDDNDVATHYRIQVGASSTDWSSLVWDSGQTAMASTSIGSTSPEIEYGSSTPLSLNGSAYYWRIKFWNDDGNEGQWSTTTSGFSMQTRDYLQDLSYTYDAVGNITRIVDASDTNSAKTMDYAYDDLYRLTRASSSNAINNQNYVEQYGYNAIGNIQNKSNVGNYIYSDNGYNNPHAVTDVNGNDYSYDNNGNLTSDGAWTHGWDYNDRLSSSTNGSITEINRYDHEGNRVIKTVGSSTSYYINDLYEVDNGNIVRFIMAGGVKVATVRGTSTQSISYSHTDHLTGSNVDTDENGTILETIDYFPYGSSRIDEKTAGYENDFKYTGKELDAETNLYYYGARYYNSDIGRWVSVDPASRNNPEQFLLDPQQMNTYSYARNNPILYNDPSGLCVWDACIIEGLAVVSASDLIIAGLAGAALVIVNNQAIQSTRRVEPVLYNSETPDETNLLPNGMPPKNEPGSGWKRTMAKIIGSGVLSTVVVETIVGPVAENKENNKVVGDVSKEKGKTEIKEDKKSNVQTKPKENNNSNNQKKSQNSTYPGLSNPYQPTSKPVKPATNNQKAKQQPVKKQSTKPVQKKR